MEYIGFFISLFALLYLFIQQRTSGELQLEEDQSEKELIRPPKKPKRLEKKMISRPSFKNQALNPALTYSKLEIEKEVLPNQHDHSVESVEIKSRAYGFIQRLESKKDLLIYKTILDKPKGLIE